MAEGSPKTSVLAAAALWVVVMTATAIASGCYGRTCDGDVLYFGKEPGQGRLLSADLWESGPIDGAWLPFPAQRVWIFDLTALGLDRLPQQIIPYVSAEADPSRLAGNFTIAAGNLAEQSRVAKGQIAIKNGTCASYHLRLVVQAAPRDSDGGSDGGTSSDDASSDDAGGDAGEKDSSIGDAEAGR